MSDLRRMIERTCADHDEFLRREEVSDFELAQKIQRFRQTLKQRSGADDDSGLHYRVQENAMVDPLPQPQNEDAPIEYASTNYVQESVDVLGDEAGKAVGRLESRINKLTAELRTLEEAVGSLKADASLDRTWRRRENVVVDLPKFIARKGHKDAA